MVRKGRGETAPPDRLKPPTWRAWKARNRSKHWYWRYPLTAEWGMEWFVYRLRSLALFDLFELAGRCTVLVVAIFWVLEADNRAKERHYRAWDLINSARGSTGDGGRRDALQDLNKDHVVAAGPVGCLAETSLVLPHPFHNRGYGCVRRLRRETGRQEGPRRARAVRPLAPAVLRDKW